MTELPASWVEVPIVELVLPNENGNPFQQGWSPQCEAHPAAEGHWGVLKTTAIQHGAFWPHENKALPESLTPRPQIEVKVGDVLMTCAGPRNRCGVACLVEATSPKLMMSGKMYRFRPNPSALFPKYLAYLIRRRESQLAIDQMKTGINDSGLNLTHDRFAKLPVPLPPVPEQHRIVARIEELFSELDASVESLTRARALLGVYRQSLLKAAFQGKLTADWRGANPDKLEPSETLLSRIRKEREDSYAKALEGWNLRLLNWRENGEVGDRPSRPRRSASAEPPTTHQRVNMAELPKAWQWLQISDIAFVTKLAGFEYTDYVKYEDDGDLPVLKAENAGPNGFRETAFSRVKSEKVSMLKRSVLTGGELLMVFVGAGTGNVGLVPEGRKFFLGPNIGMVRIEPEHFVPKFFEYFLRSPQGNELKLSTVKAVAQPSLSMETIRQIPIPVPSPAEQVVLVELLEGKLDEVYRVETDITAALSRITALRQSILKRAFSGHLVPQDANDEPVSALLARLQAEAPSSPARRKRRAW